MVTNYSLPGQCCISGTFQHNSDAAGLYRFAIVRDPLDRFLSGVHPHESWRLCTKPGTNGTTQKFVCLDTLSELWAHARALAGCSPRGYRVVNVPEPNTIKSAHWYTQSYFLSATDAHGRPFKWDFIGRLESFDQDLTHVATRFPPLLQKSYRPYE